MSERKTEPELSRRQLLRDAADALDRMEQKLRASERSKTEPIAIVGMSCRFPGGADTLEDYWQILAAGIDATSEVPATRWDADPYYSPGAPVPGKTYTRRGGFLRSPIDQFDPMFFGISPREAGTMDPQHRMLLELTWEALEDAGIPPPSLAGSQTAAYLGISTFDYLYLQYLEAGEQCMDAHFGSGVAHSMAVGRLAYFLDIHGPNFPIDTACSSSMVAVHAGCLSLRAGECSLAIAAGVSLQLSPLGVVIASNARMLSPDGRCKTFDASADGYSRGEGAGVVLLKRLSDALSAGDRIHAVIRGTAVNQDGRSSGLTAPNGKAQEAVIRAALQNAGLSPEDVGYVEAHGTGTSLGDPIEVEALNGALCQGRTRDQSLVVGSVKTNIGHLEAAAGVAGLIKTVLAMKHRQIPAHLHFKRPSAHIPWDQMPLRVPVQSEDWQPGPGGRRIAGVSSFGFSGTNAHLILEEAPELAERNRTSERPWHLLTISARSEKALTAQCKRYAEWLDKAGQEETGDVCFTAAVGRAHFTHRVAVVGRNNVELSCRLRGRSLGERKTGVFGGHARVGERPKVAFLFSGQGTQYAGMGRELYESSPVFRAAIDRCDEVAEGRIKSVLFAGSELELEQTEYTQPALFALEWALNELWRSWGLEPYAVAGHSLGEYVAAAVAGVFEMEQALRLVIERGRLMQASRPGRMAAVLAGREKVEAIVRRCAESVSIGAVNGRANVVVSGDSEAVVSVVEELAGEGVESRWLRVSRAFHSPLMEPLLDEFEESVRKAEPRPPRLRIISGVTGELGGEEMGDAKYWRRHTREAVEYVAIVRKLRELGCGVFLEVGPGAVLTGMGAALGEGGAWISTLGRGRGEWEKMLEAAGNLYAMGLELNWEAYDRPYGRRKIALPTYAFQRARYWVEKAGSTPVSVPPAPSSVLFPLTARRLRSPALDSIVFESDLTTDSPGFVAEHRFQGKTVFPAAAFVESVLEAGRRLYSETSLHLSQFQVEEPLSFPEGAVIKLQVVCVPLDDSYSFTVCSSNADSPDNWKAHARGVIGTDVPPPVDPIETAPDEILAGMAPKAFYDALARNGVEYGDSFRRIVQLQHADGFAVGRIEASSPRAASQYAFDPTQLDCCLQVTGAALAAPSQTGRLPVYMPERIGSMSIAGDPHGALNVRVRIQPSSSRESGFYADLDITGDTGRPVAFLRNVSFKRLQDGLLRLWWRERLAKAFYHTTWIPTPCVSSAGIAPGAWLILADEKGAGEELARRLGESAIPCVLVRCSAERWQKGLEYGVRPMVREDFDWLLSTAAGILDHTPLRYAVNLWPLDADAPDGDEILGSQEAVCGTTLHLVQALTSSPLSSPVRLCLVSENARPLGTGPVAFHQASLSGLARVVAAEHPELQCIHVDFDDRSAVRDLLPGELLNASGEDAVCYRSGERFVERLERCPAAQAAVSSSEFKVRGEASYLITGGYGALGEISARLLASRGATHIALLSRREPGPPERKIIAGIESLGARVLPLIGDVARPEAVQAVLRQLASAFPPLRGVIHSAGVIQDALLSHQDWPSFERIMAAKVSGAWNLHQATQNTELDFFVLFSSIASILGSPGQGNYAAANALMDGLAHHRSSMGLPAMSINWGPWARAGMAAELDESLRRRIAGRGIEEIEPDDGAEILAMLLAQRGIAQCGVVNIHWPRLLAQFPPGFEPALLARMTTQSRIPTTGVGGTASPDPPHLWDALKASLLSMEPDQRRPTLTQWVREQVGAILGIENEQIDPDADFATLGLDSLLALELRNRVQVLASTPLSATVAFDHPSVQALAELLGGMLPQDEAPKGTHAEHDRFWV